MATNLNVTRRIDIRATSDVGKATADLQKLGAAHDQLAQASAGSATVTEQSSRKMLSLQGVLDRHEQRLSATVRAQAQFDAAQRLANQATGQSIAVQEQANRVMAMAAQRYQDVAAAATASAAAQKRSVESVVAKQTITPDRGADIAAVGQRLDELRAKYVPLVNVQNAYLERLKELRSAEGRAALAPRELAAEIQRTKDAFAQQVVNMNTARGSMDKYAGASGLARHELINMSRQAQDVAVTLAMGQSPMMILMQQGTQIADIFASSQGTVKGFFGQIAAGAARVFTPVVTASTAILGLGAAGLFAMSQFNEGQRDVERSLLGIGRASGATRADINRIATESSSMFGLSTSEAREFASTLAATGRIGVKEIGEVVKIGQDVARVYGVDAADAAKMLAEAYRDPARGAEELNKRLGAFDAATLRNIQSLQAQNRIMEAQQLITRGIKAGVEGVNVTVSTSTNFWTALGNSASNAWSKFGEVLSRVTGLGLNLGIDEEITRAQRSIAELKRDLENLPQIGAGGERGQIRRNMQLSASPTDARKIEQDLMMQQHRLQELSAQWEKYGLTVEQVRGRIASHVERGLVIGALPQLGQLETAQDRANGLKRLLEQVNTGSVEAVDKLRQMGFTLEQVQLAARAAAEQVRELQDQSARQGRLVEQAEQLRSLYPGISTEIAKQAAGLADQLGVIQAQGGAQKILAQEAATYNALRRDGRTHEEASVVSGRQRENAFSEANARAREMLWNLQNQAGVAAAVTGEEHMRAQFMARTNALLRDGVDIQLAMAVAGQEYANSVSQANAAVSQQIHSLRQQTALIEARMRGREAEVASQQAYDNAIRSGADATQAAALRAATLANHVARAEEAAAGFASNMREAANWLGTSANWLNTPSTSSKVTIGIDTQGMAQARADALYGPGGATATGGPIQVGSSRNSGTKIWYEGLGSTITPNQGGIEYAANEIYSKTGSLMEAIKYVQGVGKVGTGLLQGLYDRLADEDPTRATPLMEAEIARLRQQPRTFERDDLIKSLTDALKSLQESTEALNTTIGLDPLFTQGHGYIGIGYNPQGGRSPRIPIDANTAPFVPALAQPPATQTLGDGRGPNPGWGRMAMVSLPPGALESMIADAAARDSRQMARFGGFGMASGGSFMVGGVGGQDSKYVPLALTPGELIEVTPPQEAYRSAQGKQSPPVVNNVTNNIFNFPPDRSYGDRRTQRHMREGFGRAMAQAR